MQAFYCSSKKTDKDIQDKFFEHKRLRAVNQDIRQRAASRVPPALTNGERQQIAENQKNIDKLLMQIENLHGEV